MHPLIIAVDTTTSWISNWKTGERITGNERIDMLMKTYNFQVKQCRLFIKTFYLSVLETPNRLNIEAIARKFSLIDGVRFSEPNGFGGDGNNIEGAIKGDHIIFEFYLRWCDCPAGCTEEHIWFF